MSRSALTGGTPLTLTLALGLALGQERSPVLLHTRDTGRQIGMLSPDIFEGDRALGEPLQAAQDGAPEL